MKKLFCLIPLALFSIAIGCKDSTTEPIKKNNPPIIKSISSSTDTIPGLTQIQITVYAEDADDDELQYQWESRQGVFSGTGPIVNWTSPNSIGNKKIKCTVSDGNGGKDSDSLEIRVTSYLEQPLKIGKIFLVNENPISIGDTVKIQATTNNIYNSLTYYWRILDYSGFNNMVSNENTLEFIPTREGVLNCIYYVINYKEEFDYKRIDVSIGDVANSNNNPIITKFELSKTEFSVNETITIDVEYEDPDSDPMIFTIFFVGEYNAFEFEKVSDVEYEIKMDSFSGNNARSHFIAVGVVKDSKNGKGFAYQPVIINKAL